MCKIKDPNRIIFFAVDPQKRICNYYQKCKDHIFENRKDLVVKLGNYGIKRSIENPDFITEDKTFSTTKNYYYRHGMESLKEYGAYVKTSVEYREGGYSGRVKTTFIITNKELRTGLRDKIIWKKKKKTCME